MCDNFYFNCPAKSGPGFRELTNYAPNTTLNEYIAAQNQLSRDDEYRLYLQNNAEGIEYKEWDILRKKYSCFPNECIFDNNMSLVHPNTFKIEMDRWNSTPFIDNKKYLSSMNKQFKNRISKGENNTVYDDKYMYMYRVPMSCKKYNDYNVF